jgi:hypothetical protein
MTIFTSNFNHSLVITLHPDEETSTSVGWIKKYITLQAID